MRAGSPTTLASSITYEPFGPISGFTYGNSVTYAPTLGTSRTWGVNTVTFSGAVPSPFNKACRFSYLEM